MAQHDPKDRRYARKEPCKECPFSCNVPPGETGGADPSVYIGQAVGPFFLPCHMDPGYMLNRESHHLMQCAGAAIFRANLGVSSIMPEFLLELPPGHVSVFDTPAQLLAYHNQTSVAEAEAFLKETTPFMLFQREVDKLRPHQIHLDP